MAPFTSQQQAENQFQLRLLLAFAASIGATVARIVAQPEMHR